MALHESVVSALLAKLDTRSKCVVMATCRYLREVCERPEHWKMVSFGDAEEQNGLGAQELLSVLDRSQGHVEVLHLARSAEARAAEGAKRFKNGYKHDQLLPHTQGASALQLAQKCPHLLHLSIDERASCVGGMTNDLARAMGSHCPQLRTLEVFFERYSLPSEKFTDEGLIALTEGCRHLTKLALHNCDRISDRSLYALAANCRGLTELTIGGYNENITDGGLTVLFEACSSFSRVKLSSKLLKVTDATTAALTASCGGSLTHVKMTRRMTDASIALLAQHCTRLEEVDLHRCSSVSEAAVWRLLGSCPKLTRLVLPPSTPTEQLVGAVPRCCLEVNEDRELQQLLLLH